MLSGCPSANLSESALASGLKKPINDLAVSLLADGGPKSQQAGRTVIAIYDAYIEAK
jgi:hypothetical protein